MTCFSVKSSYMFIEGFEHPSWRGITLGIDWLSLKAVFLLRATLSKLQAGPTCPKSSAPSGAGIETLFRLFLPHLWKVMRKQVEKAACRCCSSLGTTCSPSAGHWQEQHTAHTWLPCQAMPRPAVSVTPTVLNTEWNYPLVNPELLSSFLKFQMRNSKAKQHLIVLVAWLFLFVSLLASQAFGHLEAEPPQTLDFQKAAIIGSQCRTQIHRLLGEKREC